MVFLKRRLWKVRDSIETFEVIEVLLKQTAKFMVFITVDEHVEKSV